MSQKKNWHQIFQNSSTIQYNAKGQIDFAFSLNKTRSSVLEQHQLVAEEARAPQQPRRRFQRADAKSHHAPENFSQLRWLIFPAPKRWFSRRKNQLSALQRTDRNRRRSIQTSGGRIRQAAARVFSVIRIIFKIAASKMVFAAKVDRSGTGVIYTGSYVAKLPICPSGLGNMSEVARNDWGWFVIVRCVGPDFWIGCG